MKIEWEEENFWSEEPAVKKSLSTKTLTVREVFEALEKNGFDHLREAWFTHYGDSGSKPTGACVLGQAALNAGIVGSGAEVPIHDYLTNSQAVSLEKRTLESQLNRWKLPTSSKWNFDGVDKPGLGSTIIHWNDAHDATGKYELETYADVVEMAREVLSRHFDKTIEVFEWDYGTA